MSSELFEAAFDSHNPPEPREQRALYSTQFEAVVCLPFFSPESQTQPSPITVGCLLPFHNTWKGPETVRAELDAITCVTWSAGILLKSSSSARTTGWIHLFVVKGWKGGKNGAHYVTGRPTHTLDRTGLERTRDRILLQHQQSCSGNDVLDLGRAAGGCLLSKRWWVSFGTLVFVLRWNNYFALSAGSASPLIDRDGWESLLGTWENIGA